MQLLKIRLAAMCAAGGSVLLTAAVAQSQPAQPQAQLVQAPARALNLSREERTALAALQATVHSPDRAAQDAALARARAAARGADARYAVARLQLDIARGRQDPQLQVQAIDEVIASGAAQPAELAPLLADQIARAMAAGQLQRADGMMGRLVELQPNNAVFIADHAQLKARMGDRPAAVALFQRALAASGAQPAPESWHRRALAVAVEGRLGPQSIALARGLVAAYPSPVNWRDALLVYREQVPADPALDLDIRRLMRASEALAGERDYLSLAESLSQAGLAGEAKALMDEGVTRGMLETSKPAVGQLMTAVTRRAAAERSGLARLRTQALAAATGAQARAAADVHFGQGQYAAAAELYQAALQKGGEDPGLVNTRLGAALALAGRRAEAEAALRAVTGPRADLAGFWLTWLARRPA